MKFIRLNKGTVRCILSAEDMKEYGLSIDDFIEQNEQAAEFIHKLLERAGKEVGSISANGMVTLGIMQMPGGKVSVTISELSSEEALGYTMAGKLEALFRRLAQVDNIRQFLNDIGSVSEEDDDKEEEAPEALINELIVGENEEKTTVALAFANLDAVSEFARSITYGRNIRSDLYKANNEYILLVHRGGMSVTSYVRVCIRAFDFGATVKDMPAFTEMLNEHGNILIEKKALQVMKNI